MALFDVTVSRTGCIIVEADTPEEALFIAENCTDDEVSWTDEWAADYADKIAETKEDMEVGPFIKSDPYSKAKFLASKYKLYSCPTTDSRVCLTPYDLSPAGEEALTKAEHELSLLGYKTEIVSKFDEVSKILAASKRFLLVGLPETQVWKCEG